MNRADDIRRRALDLLEALGDTEEQVAASLIERGIKGVRREPCACPIWKYLDGEGIPVLSVGGGGIGIAGTLPIGYPTAIEDFIDAFDDADDPAWPELVAEVTP